MIKGLRSSQSPHRVIRSENLTYRTQLLTWMRILLIKGLNQCLIMIKVQHSTNELLLNKIESAISFLQLLIEIVAIKPTLDALTRTG